MRSADAEPPPADPTPAAPNAAREPAAPGAAHDTAAPASSTADAPAPAGDSRAETPAKPTRMTRSERQAGVVIAVVMIASVVFSWAGDTFAGDSKAVAVAAIGLGLTALLAVAVWYGHRVIGCFAAIMAGLAPMKPAFSYLPFVSLAFGGYLMFRTSQAQKKVAAARPRRSTAPRSRRSGGTKAGPRSAKEASAAPTSGTAAVRRPSANRRYTPPKAKGGSRRR
jgi:hypothetical protein